MELCRRHGVTRPGTALGAAASLPRYTAPPVVDYSNFRYAEGDALVAGYNNNNTY